jgi:FdhD protein
MVTPEKLKAFVIGYLISEGLIEKIDDIKRVFFRKSRADAKLFKVRTKLVKSSSKSSSNSMIMVEAKDIVRIAKGLGRKGRIYQTTHGTHFAALVKIDGEIISFVEDVGRHNAIDKAIGEGLLKKVDFSTCILFASCRQQKSTVSKVAKVGIVILVALVTPLLSGIDYAKEMGITLVCAKGQHLSIYTHPSRVLTDF